MDESLKESVEKWMPQVRQYGTHQKTLKRLGSIAWNRLTSDFSFLLYHTKQVEAIDKDPHEAVANRADVVELNLLIGFLSKDML